MTNNNDFNLLGDVVRLLRTKPHRIVYLLTSGAVPEPAMRLGNRRVFMTEDIDRIACKLGITQQKERDEQQ